jgi:hypothetical protein
MGDGFLQPWNDVGDQRYIVLCYIAVQAVTEAYVDAAAPKAMTAQY